VKKENNYNHTTRNQRKNVNEILEEIQNRLGWTEVLRGIVVQIVDGSVDVIARPEMAQISFS
jgi:hypothetical protein